MISVKKNLTLFLPYVLCFGMYLVAYIANIMDPDQTACMFRVHSVCFNDKSSLECIWTYAADIFKQKYWQDEG